MVYDERLPGDGNLLSSALTSFGISSNCNLIIDKKYWNCEKFTENNQCFLMPYATRKYALIQWEIINKEWTKLVAK